MSAARLAQIRQLCQPLADSLYPQNKGVQIVILLEGGANAVLPLPAIDAEPSVSDMEGAIIQVMDELKEGEIVNGEDVANRAGYAYNSHFRATLARLGRDGTIASRKPGYTRAG